MTVPFLQVKPRAIKLKVSPRFPAQLIGRAGIDVTKANGNYYLDLDFNDFPVIGSVPAGVTYALIFNPATGQYAQLPISLLGGSGGIPEAPTDGALYGRQSSAWAAAVKVAGDTMSGNLTIANPAPIINLNKTVVGNNVSIIGQYNGVRRWFLIIGDGNAESGGNTGSRFGLYACDDTGNLITPVTLEAKRENNRMTVAGDPIDALGIATKQYVDAHASGGTPGHIPAEPGTGSATASEVGYYIATLGRSPGGNYTATVGTPGIINQTAHGLSPLTPLSLLNTGGAPPGGLAVATTYFICQGASYTANSFQLATSMANAVAGTGIAISSAGTGTNTLTYGFLANGVAMDVGAFLLPAGDWDVQASAQFVSTPTTSMTFLGLWLSTVPGTFASNALANGYASYNGAAQINYNSAIWTGETRFSLAAPTLVYLSALSNFTVSTMAIYGGMRARHPR